MYMKFKKLTTIKGVSKAKVIQLILDQDLLPKKFPNNVRIIQYSYYST